MKPIYLDYNATTPVDPMVLEKMQPFFQIQFGNPASASHQWGWAAASAVKKARVQLASLLNAKESEIYFTAGATEANNWALFGLIRQIRQEDPLAKIHILTSAVEHSSVARTLQYAQRHENIEVEFVPVAATGRVSVSEVEKRLRPHTRLLSFIWVQNEIGTIQPMQELADLAKERQIYLHSDATQAVGKIPVDLNATGVDLLSGSAHKFYGPKGIGFLYIRSQHPKVQIQPLIIGGGQEKDQRSGTLNVPGIVGLGEAAFLCQQNLPIEKKRTESLRDLLWQGLQRNIPSIRLNGPPLSERAPINLNVCFSGASLEHMTARLPQLALSAGSACHSGSWNDSPILKAIGLTETEARSSLRLSLGRWTSEEDISMAIQMLRTSLES